MLSNASLRDVNYDMIIYEIKMKNMSKDMKKDGAKTFTKFNDCIHSKIIIDNAK